MFNAAVTGGVAAVACGGGLSQVPAAADRWHYVDLNGQEQGPFSLEAMRAWHVAGYFPSDRMVKSKLDGRYMMVKDCSAITNLANSRRAGAQGSSAASHGVGADQKAIEESMLPIPAGCSDGDEFSRQRRLLEQARTQYEVGGQQQHDQRTADSAAQQQAQQEPAAAAAIAAASVQQKKQKKKAGGSFLGAMRAQVQKSEAKARDAAMSSRDADSLATDGVIKQGDAFTPVHWQR